MWGYSWTFGYLKNSILTRWANHNLSKTLHHILQVDRRWRSNFKLNGTMNGSCTYLGYRGKKLELLAFTLQHEWMNMGFPLLFIYIYHNGMSHVKMLLASHVLHHSILNLKERALTATPIFILTKYSFSIFVYMSQWIVPRTEYGLEWPSEDGRAGACISLVLRIRTFYPLKMGTYALKTSGADNPLIYRHILKERNPRHHFFFQARIFNLTLPSCARFY